MLSPIFDSSQIIILLLPVLLLASMSCKNPDECNPQEPQLPPPNPPLLILPYSDTVICEGPVLFDWTVPSGSEIFQIQTDTLYSFSTAEMFLVHSSNAYIQLPYYHGRTTYWTRIRAGCSQWSDYTAWSESRRFYLWPEW
jgi:hypothetical protein